MRAILDLVSVCSALFALLNSDSSLSRAIERASNGAVLLFIHSGCLLSHLDAQIRPTVSGGSRIKLAEIERLRSLMPEASRTSYKLRLDRLVSTASADQPNLVITTPPEVRTDVMNFVNFVYGTAGIMLSSARYPFDHSSYLALVGDNRCSGRNALSYLLIAA
jgi:hypothetical protein